MLCPACHSIMRCISEIHNVPRQPGKRRMDLHCFNRENDDGRNPNRCRARCHMGVITEGTKEWACHEYSFEFTHNEVKYYLHSHANVVDGFHQHRFRGEKTILSTFSEQIYSVNQFIPISTSDDMHEQAEALFHRLRKLVIFS